MGDTGTGECSKRRLTHCAEAEQFYRELKPKGVRVRVGMEATGHSRWFANPRMAAQGILHDAVTDKGCRLRSKIGFEWFTSQERRAIVACALMFLDRKLILKGFKPKPRRRCAASRDASRTFAQ